VSVYRPIPVWTETAWGVPDAIYQLGSIRFLIARELKVARVYPLRETTNDVPGGWQLWFQWCRYDLDDGVQYGYRFVWRRPDGALQAARGQARIPSIKVGKELMDKAIAEGWGNRDGDAMEAAVERLEKHGCVVSLGSGYVGWPDKMAAAKGRLNAELMADERIIQEWS
jgi:hypothetical protein